MQDLSGGGSNNAPVDMHRPRRKRRHQRHAPRAFTRKEARVLVRPVIKLRLSAGVCLGPGREVGSLSDCWSVLFVESCGQLLVTWSI
jgi:hypothetical protein